MSAPLWKAVHASVRGTSHVATDAPCQDRHAVCRECGPSGEVLIALCADGAGSARFAEIGAEAACTAVAREAANYVQGAGGAPDEATIRAWVKAGREAVKFEAEAREAPLRDFASTLIGAVIGDGYARFFQIGDGAIVASSAGCAGVVFWPQGGEYAGTTYFLTDESWERSLQVVLADTAIDELAVFSDGLERLILRFAEFTVHPPAIVPMWAAARKSTDGAELIPALESFLVSKSVNERTDDDKTLILATRRPA